MVETVELIGKFIDISADLVRRKFRAGQKDRRCKSGQGQAQSLLALSCCREKLQLPDLLCSVPGLFHVSSQDGLDAHHGVQQIRTGIPFK